MRRGLPPTDHAWRRLRAGDRPGTPAPGVLPLSPLRRESQQGFALFLVVLFLFAIALAGAAGFRLIQTEALQARLSAEGEQALAVAEAGLQWFLGRHRGKVPDTVRYQLNGGTAVVIPRRVMALNSRQDLYLLAVEGSYTDPRFPRVPSRRVLRQYATYDRMPLRYIAPLMTTAPRVRIRNEARIYGADQAVSGECAGAPAAGIAGVVARSQVQTSGGGAIFATPQGVTPAAFQAVVDTIALNWNVLSDPTFPVDFEVGGERTWPNFGLLPPDSFPVIRWNGNLSANWSRNGRGVLIVTGTLTIPTIALWVWDGIVVANRLSNVGAWGYFTLYGSLIAGLGSEHPNLDVDQGAIYHHSCVFQKAALSLAHFTPLGGSWWEEF